MHVLERRSINRYFERVVVPIDLKGLSTIRYFSSQMRARELELRTKSFTSILKRDYELLSNGKKLRKPAEREREILAEKQPTKISCIELIVYIQMYNNNEMHSLYTRFWYCYTEIIHQSRELESGYRGLFEGTTKLIDPHRYLRIIPKAYNIDDDRLGETLMRDGNQLSCRSIDVLRLTNEVR